MQDQRGSQEAIDQDPFAETIRLVSRAKYFQLQMMVDRGYSVSYMAPCDSASVLEPGNIFRNGCEPMVGSFEYIYWQQKGKMDNMAAYQVLFPQLQRLDFVTAYQQIHNYIGVRRPFDLASLASLLSRIYVSADPLVEPIIVYYYFGTTTEYGKRTKTLPPDVAKSIGNIIRSSRLYFSNLKNAIVILDDVTPEASNQLFNELKDFRVWVRPLAVLQYNPTSNFLVPKHRRLRQGNPVDDMIRDSVLRKLNSINELPLINADDPISQYLGFLAQPSEIISIVRTPPQLMSMANQELIYRRTVLQRK